MTIVVCLKGRSLQMRVNIPFNFRAYCASGIRNIAVFAFERHKLAKNLFSCFCAYLIISVILSGNFTTSHATAFVKKASGGDAAAIVQ